MEFDQMKRRDAAIEAAALKQGMSMGTSNFVRHFIRMGFAAVVLYSATPAIAQDSPNARISPNKSMCGSMADSTIDEQIRACSSLIASGRERGRNLANTYCSRGIGYENSGNRERAIADYEQASRLDPTGSIGYLCRGHARSLAGNYDAAIADYDEAIRIDPNSSAAYHSRASVYSRKNETDKSIADNTRAIKLDPTSSVTFRSRGGGYMIKGDYDRAIADFSEAIRLHPKYAGTYGSRSLAYHYKKDYARAITDASEAIRLAPNNRYAYSDRARIYDEMGDRTRALADIAESNRLERRAAGTPGDPGRWPQKPVTIVIPVAAGGLTDALARTVALRLTKGFGQEFVVKNEPGFEAVRSVAKAAGDGHTLYLASPWEMAIRSALDRGENYDPAKDFTPVSMIATMPFVLVLNSKSDISTLAELIAHIERSEATRQNQVNYYYPLYTESHLALVTLLKQAEPLRAFHMAARSPLGFVNASNSVLALAPLPSVLRGVSEGAFRPLAISTWSRTPQLPNVPTFSESGFPSVNLRTWIGLVAPAETPKDIVNRLSAEVARALKDPEVAAQLAKTGFNPAGGGTEEFAAVLAADSPMWKEAANLPGVKER